jgi:hypothetical protein
MTWRAISAGPYHGMLQRVQAVLRAFRERRQRPPVHKPRVVSTVYHTYIWSNERTTRMYTYHGQYIPHGYAHIRATLMHHAWSVPWVDLKSAEMKGRHEGKQILAGVHCRR